MKLLVELGVVFIVLCTGSALLVGAANAALAPLADTLQASWRARLRMMALMAPVVAGLSGVVIALAPSLLHVAGLAEDHCLHPLERHHTHLCFVHRTSGVSTALTLAVAAVALVVAMRMLRVVYKWWRASREFAAVIATCSVGNLREGEYLLDSDIPLCVTAGILRPRIYISTRAAYALGPACLEAALAHERGHVGRHETRLRFLMALLEAFHLPLLGRAILQGFYDDAELLCDRFAARSVGSATVVAQALIRFQRAVLQTRAGTVCAHACLGGSGLALDTRVARLLAADAVGLDEPDEAALSCVLGVVLLAFGLMLQARHLHHVLEAGVGALSSI